MKCRRATAKVVTLKGAAATRANVRAALERIAA